MNQPSVSPDVLRWPLRTIPIIGNAGMFPLDDRGFTHHYRGPTHALHIYDYAARMKLAGRMIAIAPGDLTISPSGGQTSYDLPRPGQHYCVHFRTTDEQAEQTVDLPLYLRLGPWRETILRKLMWVAQLRGRGANDPICDAAASSALQEALLCIAMRHSESAGEPSPQRADRAVERAAAIIEQDLSRPVSVPDLARQVELSQNYLARRFRQRYGMTIPRYLLSRRIENARHLLLVTDLPIKRIAARVGLPDPQHFNKHFRKLTGKSPSGFRVEQGQ